METYRRTKVLNGEWAEDESHMQMQATLDDIRAKYPTRRVFDIAYRENKKKFQKVLDMRNSEQMMQREYYFDEGLGQSLNDHIAELKSKFEGVNVLSRRDRDGLPIVKLQMKPNYKFNLD